MATALQPSEFTTCDCVELCEARDDREQESAAVGRPHLPFFRFRLRHMFAFVAIVSALLTEIVVAQGVTGLALVVVTLVAMAHVTATALGTQLRAAGNSEHQDATKAGDDLAHRPGFGQRPAS